MSSVIIVLTNVADQQTAIHLARQLVERKLAACVNCLPGVQSVYRWQGAVEEAAEVTMLIKTSSDNYAALEQALKEAHPYELPEIVAIPVTEGLPQYMQWVIQESRPSQDQKASCARTST